MTCQSEAGSRRVLGRRGQPSHARWPHRRSASSLSSLSRGAAGVVRGVSSVEQSVIHSSFARGHRPKFRIGDRVLARWSDRRFYPACISAVIDFGESYKVDFDDGFTKVLVAGSIRRIDKAHVDRLKPVSRFSPIESSSHGSVSGTIGSVDARRRRLVRRNQLGANLSNDVSSDDFLDRRPVSGPVRRRMDVLPASLPTTSLLTGTVKSSEKCKSVGSCTEGVQRECSTPNRACQESAVEGDEVSERRHHSAPVSVQPLPSSGENSVTSLNGFHVSGRRRKDSWDKRTSMPLRSVLGPRGPQTVGEATSACSTASSSPSRSDAGHHQPICNGNSSRFLLGESRFDSSGAICHLSSELQPVLFPKIPELPPLSPHHSPPRDECMIIFPDQLTEAENRTADDGPVFSEVSKPQPSSPQPCESLPTPANSVKSPEASQKDELPDDSSLSCQPASVGVESPRPFQRRRRKKITDAVLQPPPKVVAPKEVFALADHNLFKCNVTGCDKSFRKLNRLEYHIKYYHPECKRELEAVIRRQEHTRKGTASRRETSRNAETGRGGKLSSGMRNHNQRRPLGRRRDGTANDAPGRVVRRSATGPTRSSANEDSTPSGSVKRKGSGELASPTGDLSDAETHPKPMLKRKRQLAEEHDDESCAKRARTLSSGQNNSCQDKRVTPAHKLSRADGQGGKVIHSRRALNFSRDGMLPTVKLARGSLSGMRTLHKVRKTSGADVRHAPAVLMCCPCREDNLNDELVRCPSCLCYQHLSCVFFASMATYSCPSCTRPPGLRKEARLKYANIWRSKSTLPWASLAARLRPPLSAQASSLSRQADGLSWEMLVHSLTLAHDISKEIVAVQEVLGLTRVLIQQLQTDSLENVPRDFLPIRVKTQPDLSPVVGVSATGLCVSAGNDSQGHVCSDKITAETLVLAKTEAETPVSDEGRTPKAVAPVMSPDCQVNISSVDRHELASSGTSSDQSSTSLPAVHTTSDASTEKVVPNSPRLLALLQKDSHQTVSRFSFLNLPPDSLANPPTSPAVAPLSTPMVFKTPPEEISASSPSTEFQAAASSSCRPLSPLECQLSTPSELVRMAASSSSASASVAGPCVSDPGDELKHEPAVKSPVTALSPSPFKNTLPASGVDLADPAAQNGSASVPDSTFTEGRLSQDKIMPSSPKSHDTSMKTSDSVSEQDMSVKGTSAQESLSKGQPDIINQSDCPLKNSVSAADLSMLVATAENCSSSPWLPTAEELEQLEREREVIRANILSFVEERHMLAQAQLSRLEQLVTSVENAGSFDSIVQTNAVRPLDHSALLSTTLSQLQLLREALHL